MVDKTKAEEWAELRPAAAIAQIFTFIALGIYLFNLLPQCMCVTFRPQVFRQVAYIFQTIRLFLLTAALLPCVIHGQVLTAAPEIEGHRFTASVLLALLGNILVAIGLRKFFECNRDTLMCFWRLLPFTRPYRAAQNDESCQFCCSDKKCCGCATPNFIGSKPPCEPEPVCCPKQRSTRNRCRRDPSPCCPVPKCPKPAKPKCKKSECSCQ